MFIIMTEYLLYIQYLNEYVCHIKLDILCMCVF